MPYINKPATVEDVQDFINWLETQSGIYDSQDPDNCPVAQYLKARGHTEVSFHGMYELTADGNHIVLPKNIGSIVYDPNSFQRGPSSTTYQNALERARKLHADMIYAIKPTEDPDAANEEANRRTDPHDPLHDDDSDSQNGNFA